MQESEVLEKNKSPEIEGDDKFDLLYKLLASGEVRSLDDLHNRLMPENPAETELIKRASLLHSFDETLYIEALRLPVRGKNEEISFADFTRSPKIESIPRSENIFRVREDTRQRYLEEWRRDRAKSKKDAPFIKKIVEYYESNAPFYDLDLLGVLVLADLSEAKKKFIELFTAADRIFDLARCHDILKTVEDRAALLPNNSALLKLALKNRRYLNARSFFASEYYQTNFYYARASVVKAFHKLLNFSDKPANQTNNSTWMFQLYATGGMGKTMFVRWLTARYCVPEPHRIPVARLDFDFLYLPAIESFPWLLILAIAEQLDRQIESSPFNGLLKSYGQYLSIIRPPDDAPGDNSRKDKQAELLKINEEKITAIFKKQFDILRETGFNKPFVVVLDTLEEMVLHHKESLLAVIKQLGAIHTIYQPMRLLLSGRYDLTEHLPGYETVFGSQTVAHQLESFNADEAEGYLSRKRKLQDAAVVRAIIKKCESAAKDENGEKRGSNPFSLSLFADLYEQKDLQNAQEILDSPSVEFAYLIRRVILRIKEPTVRWLLRYAVVPRRFTYDIFQKIVAPHLEKQLKIDEARLLKSGTLDRPNKSEFIATKKFINAETWSKPKLGKSEKLDLLVIWDNLRKYASGYGWISFDADDTPRLHPDVIVPMRLLLEEQDIFRPLHADAAKYFEKKGRAETDPMLWAQTMCEAIYHRFHLESETAADFWRKQIAAPKAGRNLLARLKIAEQITCKDYVDETGFARQKPNKEFLVAPADLYEAHSRVIEILLSSTANIDSVDWIEVGKHLNLLEQFRAANIAPPENYQTAFNEAFLRRLTEQLRGLKPGIAEIVSLLREALQTTASKEMLLCFEIWLADKLVILRDSESLLHYERSAQIRRSIKHPAINACEILLRIGQWYHNQGDFDRATAIYSETLPLAEKENNSIIRTETLRYLADLNLKQGLYDGAVKTIGKVLQTPDETGGEKVDALFLSQVQARALFEPLESLRGLEPFLKGDITLEESDRAAVRKLFGDVMGMLMQFGDALPHFEAAKQHWIIASNRGGLDRVLLSRVKLQIFDIGNYTEAVSLLDEWEREAEQSNLEIACQMRLLRVLLEYRNDNRSEANQLWDTLAKDIKMNESPRLAVLILATGTALQFDGQTTVKKFIDALSLIPSVSARLPLLGVFQYAQSPLDVDTNDRRAITRLLNIKSRGKDIIPHAVLRADALRVCGERNAAKRVLDRAGAEALKRQNSFAYRAVLLAKDRFSVSLPDEDSLFDSNFFQDFAAYPSLCAAGYIEQAGRFLKRKEVSSCRECLSYAQERLRKTGATTQLEAQLNELFGETAQLENNRETATHSFNLALSIYEKLGNSAAAERLRRLLPTVEQPIFNDDEFFAVRLQSVNKTLRAELLAGEATLQKKDYGNSTDDLLVRMITADAHDESSLYNLSKLLMGDLSRIEKQFGETLFLSETSRKIYGNDKRNFKLDSLSPALAKIPWELARSGDRAATSLFKNFYRSSSYFSKEIEKIKWLQIALRRLSEPDLFVDGVFGLQTQTALSIFKKKFKLPENLRGAKLYVRLSKLVAAQKNKSQAKILIVRARRDQQIYSQRSMVLTEAGIEFEYQKKFAAVETQWADNIGDLKFTLERFQPDVIHIQSSFSLEPHTGQIYLDFVSAEPNFPIQKLSFSKSDENQFVQPSAAFLNDTLAALPDSRLRPLIILDAECPPSITDVIHQLLYRNIFAADLFRIGNAAGVIGMGLSSDSKLQQKLIQNLIGGLSKMETFGAMVNSLRETSILDSLEEKISTLGIALYTNEPSLTVLSDNT